MTSREEQRRLHSLTIDGWIRGLGVAMLNDVKSVILMFYLRFKDVFEIAEKGLRICDDGATLEFATKQPLYSRKAKNAFGRDIVKKGEIQTWCIKPYTLDGYCTDVLIGVIDVNEIPDTLNYNGQTFLHGSYNKGMIGYYGGGTGQVDNRFTNKKMFQGHLWWAPNSLTITLDLWTFRDKGYGVFAIKLDDDNDERVCKDVDINKQYKLAIAMYGSNAPKVQLIDS